MAAAPEGRGRARWAGLPSRAAPARGRARRHFRLPAAASGPPFLGNNGAENGGLSGQEAARRRSGTEGARTAGTQPRAVRAAVHPQPGGRRRAAAAGGEHRGGGGLSKWPGEGRGPGPGEAAAASARSGGRQRGPSVPARGQRGGSAERGRLHPRCREGAGAGDGGPSAGVPGWAALRHPGDSPGGASRRHPDPPAGAGAGFALLPGRAGGPGTLRVSGWAGGGIGTSSFWEGWREGGA
ncbi:spidroin-1-like [Poecile atricapillus]|uniref:spidroin-1-like n=1 Tax=Poecile atricapillus TaxID=48891 RepID=UPI002738C10C|nr:spidroin-1-like [Poecile atricapillus]